VQVSGSVSENLLRIANILQENHETDHLRYKENFRTTKPKEPVELSIDNA
jgi:hypothetical protein